LRLAINNKDALNKNATNEQAIKSLAISTNNTFNTSKKIANKQLSQATKSLAIFTNDKFNASNKFSKRTIYQTRNVTLKNKNVIFELLLVNANEEIQKYDEIKRILKVTKANVLKRYFLSSVKDKRAMFQALCVFVHFNK